MTIQELLELVFQAGVEFGRKPFSHVNRNAIDFEDWLEENSDKIEDALQEKYREEN